MNLENVNSVYKLIPGDSHTQFPLPRLEIEAEMCLHGSWIGHPGRDQHLIPYTCQVKKGYGLRRLETTLIKKTGKGKKKV